MIVTISRAYGAGALAVAHALAERLGYRLVDEQLPVVAASRLGTSADVVQTVSERPRGFGERVLEQLGGGVPEAAQPPAEDPFPMEMRQALEAAGRRLRSFELDWVLWDLSQSLYPVRPYHRVRTVFY